MKQGNQTETGAPARMFSTLRLRRAQLMQRTRWRAALSPIPDRAGRSAQNPGL